ncbi:hypothetical protein F2Q69_00036467 [Brassica cretica]|uniref:Uncharacterized protein n=1 Tax=Brassica cretica TaxID=69181 RepID=A0A8S9SM81_BRACR|nr:hypothetical protein F2Q69_00036467 [Brassica cretica]
MNEATTSGFATSNDEAGKIIFATPGTADRKIVVLRVNVFTLNVRKQTPQKSAIDSIEQQQAPPGGDRWSLVSGHRGSRVRFKRAASTLRLLLSSLLLVRVSGFNGSLRRNKLKPKVSLVSLEHERDPRSESRRNARRVAAVTASVSSSHSSRSPPLCSSKTSRCEGNFRIKAEISLADLSPCFRGVMTPPALHFPCSEAPTVGLVCRISCVAWPVGEPICTAYA